jgi:hypothetical protein
MGAREVSRREVSWCILGAGATKRADAALLKIFGTAAHAFGELGFHGVLGDAEFGGDFFMRQGVEQAEGEDLAAALGQVTHGRGEYGQLLLFVDGSGDIGAVLGDRQGRKIRDTLN